MRGNLNNLRWLSFVALAILILEARAQTQTKGVETETPMSLQRQGKVYALIVGVSDYQSEMINDLRYAAADARSLAEYLRSAPIGQGKVIELYDKQATRASIYHNGLLKIDAMVFDHTIRPEDLIIIYFSGHGGAFTKSDSYFFPYDAAHTTDAGSSFSIRDIKTFVERWANPEKKLTVMFIFDACRSATLARGQSEMDLVEVSKYLEVDNNEILMAASQGGEPAQERGELKHGVFSYYLIEGLYGKADVSKDGSISIAELQNYVANNVYNKTATAQQPLIRYPALFQKRALVPVKAELLAQVDQKLMLDLSNQDIIAMATKGGSENAKAVQLSELIGKFNASLSEGRLVRPSNDCAYGYFKQMMKVVPASTLEDYRTELVIALYDAALNVIKHDLNGERRYLRPRLADSKQGYDLDYYEDAFQSIKAYASLMQGKVEPVALAMQQYLAGRSLTVKFLETKYTDQKLITAAIAALKKGTLSYPNQAFLWQGLAMAYLEDPTLGYSEAKTAALRARELAPQWSYPLVTLSTCAKNEDQPEQASDYIKKAIELNPFDFYPYLILGDREEDPKSALRWYLKAHSIDSSAMLTVFGLGWGYYRLSHYDSARTFFRKTLTKAPEFRDNYTYLAHAEHETGNLKEAESLYRKAIDFFPQDPMAYNNLANILADQGQREEAVVLYHKAIQLDSTDGDFYYNLANTLDDLDDLDRKEEAIVLYHKAIQLDSTDGDYCYNLGNALYNLDRKEEAVALYQKAIQLDSTDGDYYNGLGICLDDLDQKEEAIALYQKAIQLDSTHGDFYFNFANVLDDLNRKEEAVPLYQKAIQLDSTDAGFYNNLANTLDDLDRKQEAVALYQKAIQLDSTDGDYYCNLANIFGDLDRKAEAVALYQRAIQLDSTNGLYYFNFANTLGDLDREAESVAFYQKAIQLDSTDGDFYNNLADALKDLDRKKEAVSYYRKAIHLDSTNVYRLYKVADVYRQLSDPENATLFYRKALRYAASDSSIMAWSTFYIGNKTQAEKILLELLNRDPNSDNSYNYACFLALTNQPKEALKWLEKSLKQGYDDWEHLEKDEDLNLIRDLAGYRKLIKKYKPK